MQKLVENVRVSGNTVKKISLKESRIQVNESDMKVASAFRVPIWRLDEKNLNNRTYSKKVAEKVVRENKTTVALADHPKDDGSVWDIVAVAKNPTIDNGMLWAEAYFVDETMAKKVDKIVEYGGEIGLSSSAYGEVDDSGHVLEEGFEIERYFDLVLEPSYQVFIDPATSRIQPESTQKTSESVDKQPQGEDLTINTEGKFKELSMANYDKLQEVNFRMNVKGMVNEAMSHESLFERRDALNEILGFMEEGYAEDIRGDVETKLTEVNQAIEEAASKGFEFDQYKGKVEETADENTRLKEEIESQKKIYESKIASLENKNEKANELIENLRGNLNEEREAKLWEEAKKNGRVSAGSYVDLVEAFKNMKAQNEELVEKNASLEEKNQKLRNRKENATATKKSEKINKRVHRPVTESQEEKQKEKYEIKDRPSRVKESKTEDNSGEIDMNFSNEDEVKTYFNERLAEDSRYQQYADEILSCKTLQEAQIKAMSVDLDAVPTKEPKNRVSESRREQSTILNEEDTFMSRLRRKDWI